jgi:hypothetical protein
MKPILFSSPMVQAILAGRKTQTRRVMNPQPTWVLNDGKPLWPTNPKYLTGDILYVRETWSHYYDPNGHPYEPVIIYKADFGPEPVDWNWKPNIFMPKAAARIFLQVTDVRAERLQDITEEDAIAEGIECIHESDVKVYRNYLLKEKLGSTNPVNSFSSLWNSINAKTSPWKKNDWVWVYTFKKIENPNQ